MKKFLGLIFLILAVGRAHGQTHHRPVFVYPPDLTDWPNSLDAVEDAKADEIDRTFKKALDAPETDLETFHHLAVNFLRWGNVSNALICAERAATPDSPLKANALVALAVAQERAGRLKKAAATWATLAHALPDQPRPRYQNIRLRIEAGEVDGVIETFSKYVKRHPRRATPNLLLGMAFLKKASYRQAWRYLAKAALIPTSGPEAKIMLAQVTLITEDYEESLGWFKKGLHGTDAPKMKNNYFKFDIFDALKRFPEFRALEQKTAELITNE